MLPIRVPSFIGVPFHGLVIDGVLTLPNGQTMPYAGSVSSFTQILRNPAGVANARARTPDEQAADTAVGMQWLDYGIRNGNSFNRRALGQGKPWMLYSDPAGTVWLFVLDRINDVGVVKPRLYNLGPFGRLRHGGAPPPDYSINTLLWSADITPSDDEAIGAENTYVQELLQNTQGTKALYKIFRQITGSYYAERYDWVRIGVDADGGRRMSDLYELTISGTGSLELGSIGQGISVSASLVADFGSLYTDNSVSISQVSELDVTGECGGGAIALSSFQVFIGNSPQGPSVAGSNELTQSFSAKLNAYYGASDVVQYVERSYTNRHTYTLSASASATQDINTPNVTYCYLFDGSSTTFDELEAGVTNAGVSINGAWEQTRERAGSYDDCVTGLTSELPYECSAAPTVAVNTVSLVESGSLESAEIYVTRLTAHGGIIVAQGYDDNGTKRYTRTVIAPDGNTLALAPVDAPMTYDKIRPDGVAWNPVTGQIVSYPGQVVGFV